MNAEYRPSQACWRESSAYTLARQRQTNPILSPCPTAWLSHGRQRVGRTGTWWHVEADGSLPPCLSSSPPLILLPPVEEDARAHPSSCPPSLQNAVRRSFVLNGTGHLQLESVRCLFFFPLKSSGSHLYSARRCLLSDWMSQSQSDTYGRSILNIYIWWLHKLFFFLSPLRRFADTLLASVE